MPSKRQPYGGSACPAYGPGGPASSLRMPLAALPDIDRSNGNRTAVNSKIYYPGRGDTNKALILNSHGWDGLGSQNFCYVMSSIVLSAYSSSPLDF